MSDTSTISSKDLIELDRYADKQSDISAYDQVLKLPIPNASRFGSYVIFILMIISFYILYYGKIDIIVQAKGLIRTIEDTYYIEAPSGGMITRIMARAGDRVLKNEPIIYLDSSEKNISLDQLEKELLVLQKQLDKYKKSYDTALDIIENPYEYLKLKASPDLKEDLLANYMKLKTIHFNLENIKNIQKKTLLERKKQILEEIRLIQKKIKTLNTNKEIATNDLKREKKNVARMKKMLEDTEKLTSEGYYSTLDLNREKDAYNSSLEIYENKNKILAEINISLLNEEFRLNELNINLQEIQRDYNKQLQAVELSFRQALEELSENLSRTNEVIQNLTNRISEKQGQMKISRSNINKSTILMPFTGYIGEMNVKNVGQSLIPGEVITTAFPENSPLEVITKISNKDIGFISKNTIASIKVDAYHYKEFGSIEGVVTRIIPNISGHGGFSVIVKLSKQHLKKGNKIYELFPGLTVTADFVTHKIRLYQLVAKEFRSLYENVSENTDDSSIP